MQRLVQLKHPIKGRRVALVRGNKLRLLKGPESIYEFAQLALTIGRSLADVVKTANSDGTVGYDLVYNGKSPWQLLPAFDHPASPASCLITGTGLTHKASAENRQAMHTEAAKPVTDSMRMYQSGLEGGRPAPGRIGSQPEWFYKGNGRILRAHGEPLIVPPFGLDGGEEAEVAGIYLIDAEGDPRRVGFAQANEFSDHKWESKNYLWLAHSKLRTCSIGPELIVDGDFTGNRGTVTILRGKKAIWSKPFATGEKYMSHTVANLEHHHFKYSAHRHPGDVHIHFFGADVFSYGDGVELKTGDVMKIELTGFGRPLRNPIQLDRSRERVVTVASL